MLGFAAYAWVSGNYKQLTTAYDPDRKGCGVDYPEYPYIYFASPHANVTLTISSHSGSLHVSQNAQLAPIPACSASPIASSLHVPKTSTLLITLNQLRSMILQ